MSETETQNRKTGATPQVTEGVGGGEVLGVVENKLVTVNLRDGHGQLMVKLAVVMPGGDVYFLDDKAVSKPAQTWVKKGVLRRLGLLKE